jgi:hypothetical protein
MAIQITYYGLSRSVRHWADLVGIRYHTLLARIRLGWSPERALETPVRHVGTGPRTHGATGSKEYRAWQAMIGRCFYPGYHAYHRYGGRGLEVCERWRKDFLAFFADVGAAPSPDRTLGRIDNDRGYDPGNVAWQTLKDQNANRAKPRRAR